MVARWGKRSARITASARSTSRAGSIGSTCGFVMVPLLFPLSSLLLFSMEHPASINQENHAPARETQCRRFVGNRLKILVDFSISCPTLLLTSREKKRPASGDKRIPAGTSLARKSLLPTNDVLVRSRPRLPSVYRVRRDLPADHAVARQPRGFALPVQPATKELPDLVVSFLSRVFRSGLGVAFGQG